MLWNALLAKAHPQRLSTASAGVGWETMAQLVDHECWFPHEQEWQRRKLALCEDGGRWIDPLSMWQA